MNPRIKDTMSPTMKEGRRRHLQSDESTTTQRNMTEREKEILRFVAAGRTNKQISNVLKISPETIKSELKRIFRKIGVNNRTQASVLGVREGWL